MQWAESLFKELDYRKEAANGIRFKELYGDLEVRFSLRMQCCLACMWLTSSKCHIIVVHCLCGSSLKHLAVLYVQGVYVPDMILEHTTGRVLVMEWVEGRRLRRAGKNGEGPSAAELQEDLKLVEIGVQCSLEQVWPCLVHK